MEGDQHPLEPSAAATLLAMSTPGTAFGSKAQIEFRKTRPHKAQLLGWSEPESRQPWGQALCDWELEAELPEFAMENSRALWDLCWWG